MANIIIILAALRITRLLMHDTILGEKETLTETTYTDPTGFRLWLEKHRYTHRAPNFVARLIECAWCTTVWATVISWVAYQYMPTVVTVVALMHIAAISALLTDFLHRVFTR